MHAISSYRGNRPTHTHTNPPTHKQTGLITIHCAAASAQCNYGATSSATCKQYKDHQQRTAGGCLMMYCRPNLSEVFDNCVGSSSMSSGVYHVQSQHQHVWVRQITVTYNTVYRLAAQSTIDYLFFYANIADINCSYHRQRGFASHGPTA